ncbi:alpha-amylase family protein [uncultured Bacteroides sp.]|uniref:alpha-amylase family protein n=1 Tax=uncultured Bacteroides sp. TaxID=162156 RepID=UPI002AA95131|nr:alpha-amylase family protein [uncultured Bacteroides sp.]
MNDKKKIIIYQVLPRLFGNNNNHCIYNGDIAANGCGKLTDFTPKVFKEIKKLGTTHIWYTGIIEHATQTDYRQHNIRPDHPAIVKGKAGSPYAIKDYYDIDPDLVDNVTERMREFEALIKRTHQNDLRIIIDFIPNHVARQYHSDVQPKKTVELGATDDPDQSFSPYNNFYYIPQTEFHGQFDLKAGASEPYREYPAKATGNNRFDATPNINDWYETIKLNYGIDFLNGGTHCFSPIPDTWTKMLDILFFWASKGVDGFRCDMAEMVPVEFWEWAISQIKTKHPHLLFVAEVYNPTEYRNYLSRGKFDYLYDKVGLYDTLRNIICGYDSANAITRSWQSLGGIEKKMLNFLENHDEQRIASDFFAGDARKAIPALIVSSCMNTNPMLIYFGQELGEPGMDTEGFSGRDGRTSIFDYWSIDSIRRWRNGGKFDGKKLTNEQKRLQATYQNILTICSKEPAISEGLFFDLMYVNQNGWRFNEHKQYVFLRKHKHELLFILINFDCISVEIAVNIPSHAFDYLQIPLMESYEATDLLTNKKEEISLLPYKATETSISAYGGKILKIIV